MAKLSFAIAAVICVTGASAFEPSTEIGPCHNRPDGFARDVTDCRNYFICQNNRATRDRCPNNLLFDAENEICNWPEEVKCFQCPAHRLYSMLPAPRTCNQFYRCWQGRATIHSCPNGLVFNPNNLRCGFLEGSGCEGDSELRRRCPARDGDEPVLMPDEFNCSTYHVCHNGEPVRQECDDGLHFNPVLGSCDTPENANCAVREAVPEIDESEEPEWPPAPANALPCPDSGSGFVPHSHSCNAYYACSQQQLILLHCASGMHYDYVRRVCDRPRSTRCWAVENE